MSVSRSISVPDSCVVQTPTALADAMVLALGCEDDDRWLEPCVGHGALLAAMSRKGVPKQKIIGLDVDGVARPNDRHGAIARGTEFLRWSSETKLRFNKVIANPPYVALERLNTRIKKAALGVRLSQEISVSGNSNAWYAFICASIKLLADGGSLCFLLPAAWDYANYAEPLRSKIARYFSTVEIFRTARPIFRADNVEEGAVVVLAKGRKQPDPTDRAVHCARYEVASLDELIEKLSDPESRRREARQSMSVPSLRRAKECVSLGDILKINLGVVTGDANYFLLSDEKRRELNLPTAAMKPVLSKAKHLVSGAIDEGEWSRLRNGGERVWLFSPSDRMLKNSHVRSYLRFGVDGGCKVGNHKIAVRDQWFRCPEFAPCDGFMSGMSSALPALSLRAMPNLIATNTLYAVRFRQRIGEKARLSIAMSLLTSDVREQMRACGRPYAAGLLKHEPSDLLKLVLPNPQTINASEHLYRLAFEALRAGDAAKSCAIADACKL